MALFVRQLDVKVPEEEVIVHIVTVLAYGLDNAGSLESAVGLYELTDTGVGLGLCHEFVPTGVIE